MRAITIITILLFCCSSVWAQNDSTLYSFFVAGHTYGQPGANNAGFHPPFKDKFPYIQSRPEIEFGVLTGDIVSPFPIAQDWDEIDADIELLDLPVYFAVGNHDMENRPLFEERYGDTYFDFTHNNDLFIVLDPNLEGWSITGDQLQFLQNSINDNASNSDNIFVFFHQILWKETSNVFNYISWNSSAGRIDPVNFWPTVIPIFEAIPNDVYMFAGDLGASWSSDVTYDQYNNISLISSGMGDPDGENFLVVNVDADKEVNYDLICLSDPDPNCLGMLTNYLMVDSVSQVEEIIDPFNYSIYPNPTREFINISSDHQNYVQLFDSKGTLVLEAECNVCFEQKIDISSLNKGLYFVRVTSDKGTFSRKLIVE